MIILLKRRNPGTKKNNITRKKVERKNVKDLTHVNVHALDHIERKGIIDLAGTTNLVKIEVRRNIDIMIDIRLSVKTRSKS